jgi:hypothetical protein
MKKTARDESEIYRKAFSSLSKEKRCLEYSKVRNILLLIKFLYISQIIFLYHTNKTH